MHETIMLFAIFAGIILWMAESREYLASGGWQSANATYYTSYPACCKNAPNYDPKASKTECTQYSGCDYMGQFAGVNGKLSYSQVRSKNIVAFYSDANQKSGGMSWWNKNVKGRKLYVRNPKTGKTLLVEALDTCGNSDCNGCCSKSSRGGTLIDFEENTAKRFYGGKIQGEARVQWKWA